MSKRVDYKKPNAETLSTCTKELQLIINQLSKMQVILRPIKSAKGGQEKPCSRRVTNNSDSNESLSMLHSAPEDRGFQRMITVQTYPDGSKSKMYVFKKDEKATTCKKQNSCGTQLCPSKPPQTEKETKSSSDEEASSCPYVRKNKKQCDEPPSCPYVRKNKSQDSEASSSPYVRKNKPQDSEGQTCNYVSENEAPACPYVSKKNRPKSKKEKCDDEEEQSCPYERKKDRPKCPSKKIKKEKCDDEEQQLCPIPSKSKQCRFRDTADAKDSDLSDPFGALQMMLVPKTAHSDSDSDGGSDDDVPPMDKVAQKLFNDVMDKVMQSILNIINLLQADPVRQFQNKELDEQSLKTLQTDLAKYRDQVQQTMRSGMEQLYLSLSKPTCTYAPELKRVYEIQTSINKFLASNLASPACMPPPAGLRK